MSAEAEEKRVTGTVILESVIDRGGRGADTAVSLEQDHAEWL